MARWIASSPDAETLRALLHPARDRGAAGPTRVPVGLFVRAAADPSLSRALAVVAGRLDAAGALGSLARADRAVAEGVRAWSIASVEAMRRVLAPLGATVARRGIVALLCKGAGLHGLLYADPTARPASDVDVFVPLAHVLAFDAALREAGHAPTPAADAAVEAFRATGARRADLIDLAYRAAGGETMIEVKADPISIGRTVSRLADLAAGSTPSPVHAGFGVPSPETMVLAQVFSRARKGAPDLLAHAEIAGVLHARAARFDPARMLDLVRGEGLYGILRGVLSDTDAAFPGTVPAALLRRRGRPAGFTPARVRRGTLRPQPPRRRASVWALWAASAIGGSRPLRTLAWSFSHLFPPRPMLAYRTGGRRGLAAISTRLRNVAREETQNP